MKSGSVVKSGSLVKFGPAFVMLGIVLCFVVLSACAAQLREPAVDGVDPDCLAELGEKFPPQSTAVARDFQGEMLRQTCDFLRLRRNPKAFCPEWSAATYSACLQSYLDHQSAAGKESLAQLVLVEAYHVTATMQFRKAEKDQHSPAFFAFHLLDFSLASAERLASIPEPGQEYRPESDAERLALLQLQAEDRKSREVTGKKLRKVIANLVRELESVQLTAAERKRLRGYKQRLDSLRAGG